MVKVLFLLSIVLIAVVCEILLLTLFFNLQFFNGELLKVAYKIKNSRGVFVQFLRASEKI